jgi:hypothetical protein
MWRMKVAICPPLHELLFLFNCAPLALLVPWQGSCFGHAFNKACQYSSNGINMCWFSWNQFEGHTIYATKNNHMDKSLTKDTLNGRRHVDLSFFHQKLKTLVKTKFANKMIMFQETMEYYDVINLQTRGSRKLKSHKIVCRMHTPKQFVRWLLKPCFLLWNNVSSIKTRGYWLLFYAINATLLISAYV